MGTCVRGGAVQMVGLSGLSVWLLVVCMCVCVKWLLHVYVYYCDLVGLCVNVSVWLLGLYDVLPLVVGFCVCKKWWLCAWMCVCVCLKPTLIQHSSLLVDFTPQASFLFCIISPTLLLNSLLDHSPKHTYSRVLPYKTKSFLHLFPLQLKFLKDCYPFNSTSSLPIYSLTHFSLAPIPTSLWKSTQQGHQWPQWQIQKPFFWT